ncbi:MAG: protein-S-isoprenylcysteine O-methyltransferase Ste14 [Saprospiraceae bacterium]|jgi:protein-S-isoprenylcysteine O-methyltransferase Ste14|tara:strand:- start:1348 stop:1866 length:519 start_codon:yes stop_codon:yes gene_type:complete
MDFQKYFKTATSESWLWNVSKTLIQTALFWIVFLFLLPDLVMYIVGGSALLTFSPLPNLGIVAFAIFSVLGLWSGITMSVIGQGTPLPTDCPSKLVIKGPYRLVRNPMAVAGIGQGISIGLYFGALAVIVYALVGAVLWHYFVRPAEEEDLEKRFGEDYLDYKRKVKCWLPF